MTFPDLGIRQQIMRDASTLRRLDRCPEEVRILVIGSAGTFAGDGKEPVLHEQRLAGLRLELAPDLMRAAGGQWVLGAPPPAGGGGGGVAPGRTPNKPAGGRGRGQQTPAPRLEVV